MNYSKLITIITATLFIVLALMAFAVSYQGLQITAYNNGKAGWMSYIIPLIVDGGIIIFSLAVVYKSLRNEPAWFQWFLVGLFTVVTVSFNIFQESNHITVYFVKSVAPIMLLLTFESLMGIVTGGVKRREYQANIAELRDLKAGLQNEVDKLQRKVDNLVEQIDSPRKEQVYNLVAEGVKSARQIADTLQVSHTTVYKDLNELIDEGTIAKNGKGYGVA